MGRNSLIVSSLDSTTRIKGNKNFDHTISSASSLMDVDSTVDVTFHLSRELKNKKVHLQ